MIRRAKTRNLVQFGIVLMILGLLGCIAYYFYTKASGKEMSLQEIPEGYETHLIDVSHHQGEIDWQEVLKAMDSTNFYVYCKATEGAHFIDEQYKENRSSLESLGIVNGAYHFFLPGVAPEKQARHFLKHFSYNTNDLPPVIDAEMEDPKGDAHLIHSIRTWLYLVEVGTGRRPFIYTSYDFYDKKFRNEFPGYKFWIASYNMRRKERMDDDVIRIWQYSDRGRISGIDENVDLNFVKPEE